MTAQMIALPPNPSGLCQCGCGSQTTIARDNNPRRGHIAGHPVRFIKGHQMRVVPCKRGPEHKNWKGGRFATSDGYIVVSLAFDHPFATMGYREKACVRVLEHRLVMAQYLGRPLLRHEYVHHINGRRDDNDLSNLQLRITAHGAGQCYRCLDCGSRRVAPTEIETGN